MNYRNAITGSAETARAAQLVGTCPRCDATNIAFDVTACSCVSQSYSWRNHYEVFAVCTGCNRATILVIHDKDPQTKEYVTGTGGLLRQPKSLNNFFDVEGYINLKHRATAQPPDQVPAAIATAFGEGATCMAVECWNAAAGMFRLCVDLATVELLPSDETDGLNAKTRRDLGLRLPWLFAHGKLAADLHDLSNCIKDDGNDGVHRGTLTQEDASDIQDFTTLLLERLYTEPARIRIAKERTKDRRQPRPA
jgi:hypothetical protein